MMMRFAKISFLILCSVLPSFAFAGRCGVAPLGAMRLFGAYDRPFEMPILEREHQIEIGGCGQESYNQFLAIKFGPNVMSVNYIDGYEHRDLFTDDMMTFENSPIGPRDSYETRLAHFKAEREFVQTCVVAQIQDPNTPLRQPQKQLGCEVELLDSKTARFTGSICYFKITPQSSFKLTYMFNPKCQDPAFLRAKNLKPMDVRAGSGILIVPTADGTGLGGDPIARRSMRVALESSEKIFPLDDSYDATNLRWPNVAAFDPHFGDIVLTQEADDRQVLMTRFLVNNQCQQRCLDGFCTSACDRLVPFGALANAFELKPNGKRSYVDSWYTSAVLLGNWQGFVPSMPRVFEFKAFQPGKTYRLEASLDYLDQYYRLGEEGLAEFVLELPDRYPGVVGRDPLPRLNLFPSFSRRIPRFPTLPSQPRDLEAKFDANAEFWSRLYSISQYMGEGMEWPPYIKTYCDATYTKCNDMSKGQVRIMMWAEFKVDKFDMQTNKYVLSGMKWGRTSNTLSSYSKDGQLPQIVSQ